MISHKNSSKSSSINKIKTVIQNKQRIYFRKLLAEADVSSEELEDFLIPLLCESKIEGTIEVRCPTCGADLGSFKKYDDIPKRNSCEICGKSNTLSDDCLEILLEVKDGHLSSISKIDANIKLDTLLKQAKRAKGSSKGKLFEEFFSKLVEREAEFSLIDIHARSDTGEIDFIYKVNCSNHPLWDKCKYICVECKNIKKPVSSSEMDHFISMLEHKTLWVCCGIYVTTNSFSPQANDSAKKAIAKGLLLFRIERKDIASLMEKGLKRYLEEDYEALLTKI